MDQLAVEALQYTAIRCRRVSDHETVGADDLQRGQQALLFDKLTATDISAVPQRTVGIEQLCSGQLFHGGNCLCELR